MPQFLSNENINRLIFYARDIYPEDRWDTISRDLKNEAVNWYRKQDSVLIDIGGLAKMNKDFLHYLAGTMHFNPQDNDLHDPEAKSEGQWIFNNKVSFYENPIHFMDSPEFIKEGLHRTSRIQNGTTASIVENINVGGQRLGDVLDDESKIRLRSDYFRGRVKQRKMMDRNTHSMPEELRLAEEDYTDNLPRERFKLHSNNTMGTTPSELAHVSPEFRYTPEFDVYGRPYMYDKTTNKLAASYGLVMNKLPSLKNCDKQYC